MNARFPILAIFLLLASCVSAQTDTPEGRWATTDDETGEQKSIVEIYGRDGKYFGKIEEILTGNKDARCTECSGKLKNKPTLGLVIINNLDRAEEGWDGGTILDPQKGAEYKLSAWFEDDPDILYIRGKHWTGLYRTQTWKRVAAKP